MTVHLVNPSHLAFGVGVITPRWLFVLGAATPAEYGRPRIVDETLEALDLDSVQRGDIIRHEVRGHGLLPPLGGGPTVGARRMS